VFWYFSKILLISAATDHHNSNMLEIENIFVKLVDYKLVDE